MQQKRNSYLFVLILVGIVSAFGPFVTDFYLPALPELTTYFNTTASMAQLSLTFSMIGLGAGQLFIGPLSDKYGRRSLLLISMVFFLIATVGCIVVPDVETFLLCRLLQGLAGAGGVVISKSIATDLYEGKELARFFSMLSAVQGLAPICAPVLGGVLLEVTDWRGIFGVLLIIGVLLIVMLLFFRESLSPRYRINTPIWSVFKGYRPVLQNRQFIYYVLIQAFAMGVMFTYIAASPFIFQEHYGISSLSYSVCFGINALAIMMGSFFVMRFRSVRRGLGTGSVAFLVMSVITAMILVNNANVIMLEISLVLLLFCLGMILPTSTTLALELERSNSGSASAVLGFLMFLFGGIVSPLAGLGNMLVSTALLIVIGGSCTLVFAVTACGRQKLAIVLSRIK